jgi:AcrR family transcriptional regulator
MTSRVALSRGSILTAAMHLAETDGTTQLSLNKLGQALGVDATAVYRHFRDKDELMLALGDLLIQEAVAHLRPRRQWNATLESIAMRLREVCLARPALAQQIAVRFTGGDGEIQLRDQVMAALAAAGLTGPVAARQCRAFVEMTLGHIALTATLLSLPDDLQQRDVLTGLRVYDQTDTAVARTQVRSRPNSARRDEDAVFRVILANFIQGLRAALPG